MKYLENKLYDIEYDGKFKIVLINSYLESQKLEGKNQTFRTFDVDKIILPEELMVNVKDYIKELRSVGYNSITELVKEDFKGVIYDKPFNDIKLMMLGRKYRLLEKIYEETSIDRYSYIKTYLHCINMFNGEEVIIPMGFMKNDYNEDLKRLKDNGYKHISETVLKDYINTLYNKKLVLERKKSL